MNFSQSANIRNESYNSIRMEYSEEHRHVCIVPDCNNYIVIYYLVFNEKGSLSNFCKSAVSLSKKLYRLSVNRVSES